MRKDKKVSKLALTLIVCVILIALVALFFSSDWNRAAFGSQGYIENGSKFGVTIGEPVKDTHQTLLSKGLTPFEIEYNPKVTATGVKQCHGHTYSDDVTLEAFADESWRRGIICVASKENKIVRLSWHYGMFQP